MTGHGYTASDAARNGSPETNHGQTDQARTGLERSEGVPDSLALHLEQCMGLDRDSVGRQGVGMAVRQRAATLGLDMRSYARFVLTDAEESQKLVETVVVPETWFFRDVEPYVYLARLARDRMLRPRYDAPDVSGALGTMGTSGSRTNAAGPLRVLSVPSSTGEEPYSIAMALLDAGFKPHQFQIDAWDISRNALKRARRGVYGPSSFRTPDLGFRQRHFTLQDNGTYLLNKTTRDCVHFHQGNLAAPGFGVGEPPYHAVFCRNLLIYFTKAARSLAIQSLERLLMPKGVLFTGHTEILLFQRLGYVPVNHTKAFACSRPEKTVLRSADRDTNPVPQVRIRPVRRWKPALEPTPPTAKTTPAAAAEKTFPMKAPQTHPAETPQPSTQDLLRTARKAADQGELDRAESLCSRYVEANPSDACGHALLGLVHQAAGRPDQAEKWLHKALYLAPDHYEALVHMSLLCAMRGDTGGEANYKRRAARCTPLFPTEHDEARS